MAKIEPKKPTKTIEACGLLRTPDGYQVVTVLCDEDAVVERSAPDTLFIIKHELKKAWVRLVAKAGEGL
jgi:hypothetical protein